MTDGSELDPFPRVRHLSHAGAGADLLSEIYMRRARLPTDALFAELWRAVEGNAQLFEFRQLVYNRFHLPWRNMIFDDLSRDMRRLRDDFRLQVSAADPVDAARILTSPEPIVGVSIHSGVALTVLRIGDVYGRKVAVIGARVPSQANLALFEFNHPPLAILRGPDCLIEARKAAREGHCVMSLVDYALADPIAHETTMHLSPSVFAFAAAMRARLVFVYPEITADGTIRMQLRDRLASGRPEDLAAEFRSFLAPLRPGSATWEIGDWAGDTGGRSYAVRGLTSGAAPVPMIEDDPED